MLFTKRIDVLLSGPQQIDVDSWEKHTRYEGRGCTPRSPIIQWFWSVVKTLSLEEKRRLLRFATSQSNAPVGGFQTLSSAGVATPFTISLKGPPTPRNLRSFYPTAATCANMLHLPRYACKEDLEKHLLLAIREEMMGFEEFNSDQP